MARRTAKKGRGAVPADGSRIRNEVAAIALVAFAVLSLVALFADANAVVLNWWQRFLFSFLGWGAILVPFVLGGLAGEMWFGLLRRSMAAPITSAANRRAATAQVATSERRSRRSRPGRSARSAHRSPCSSCSSSGS